MTVNDIQVYERNVHSKYDYFINWQVNNICNYHCWFCNQIRKNNYHYTQEDVQRYNQTALQTVKRLNAELQECDNKKIKMSILGGEPTLSDIPSLLELLQPRTNSIHINITTNFSCSEEYINKVLSSIKDKNIYVLFSVSVHQTETNMDKLIEKIIKFKDNIVGANIVVFDEQSFHDYEYLSEQLKNIDIQVQPQVCMDNSVELNNKKIFLTQDIMDKLEVPDRKSPDKIVNGKKYYRHEIMRELGEVPIWTGFKCWAWTKINSEGKIKTCVYKPFRDDGKILRNDYQICESLKPCKLCFQTKLERTDNDEYK